MELAFYIIYDIVMLAVLFTMTADTWRSYKLWRAARADRMEREKTAKEWEKQYARR